MNRNFNKQSQGPWQREDSRGGRGGNRGFSRDSSRSGGSRDGSRSGGSRDGSRSGGSRDSSRSGGGRYNSGNQQFQNRGPPRQSNQQAIMPQSESYSNKYPTQLKPGTLGRPVQLIGNFYKLITASVITVYHYRLNVGGESDKKDTDEKVDDKKRQSLEKFYNKFTKEIVDEFVKQNEETFGNEVRYIYSSLANFYTNQELSLEHPALKNDLTVSIEERDREIRIEPELVDQFELDPDLVFSHTKPDSSINSALGDSSEKILTVYDILFGFLIGKQYECFRRKYFDLSTAESLHCQPFMESVSGFLNSVRRTQFGLALNLHLKSACKISNRFLMLTDLIETMLRTDRPLTMDSFTFRDLGHINRIVRHLRVFTKHTGRQTAYQIDQIIMKTAADQTFRNQKTGQNISVKDYFLQEYNIQLKPLPLVQTVGGRYQIPMELCHLFDNQFLSDNKLGSKVQDEMLKRSTFSPTEYFDKLQRIVDSIVKMDPEVYNKFSVNVTPKPVQFEGRVLDKPRINTGRNKLLSVVQRRISISFYCFLDNRQYPAINNNELNNFVNELTNTLTEYGFNIGNVFAKCVEIGRLADIERLFSELNSKKPIPDLLMTGIINDNYQMDSKKQYNLVKHLANQKYQFVSQCFDIGKVAKRIKPGYLEKIILKINAKLGGVNSEIEPRLLDKIGIDFTRTMLVGVDVNHPGATEKVESSIACAVGSYDEQFSCYSASIRVQKRERQEVVTQLESMIDELLTEYYKKNQSKYPANIVVFRDGVSEGQFKTIKDVEIPLIQNSINKIQSKSQGQIKLTVLVIQKRHQIRFSLISPNTDNFRRETYNVSSGTVVDQSIVDPDYKMFLLNSHDSAMGTSKSSKYVLLRDDLALSTDQLQTLCYYSCYNCCRTLKPISIPTPIRYADLCAYRSKLHILAQIELQANQLNVEVGGSQSLANRMEQMELEAINKLNKMVKLNDEVKNQLYYC